MALRQVVYIAWWRSLESWFYLNQQQSHLPQTLPLLQVGTCAGVGGGDRGLQCQNQSPCPQATLRKDFRPLPPRGKWTTSGLR